MECAWGRQSYHKALWRGALGDAMPEVVLLRGRLGQYLVPETATSRVVFEHACAHPGKMLRPALFLLSCDLFGDAACHEQKQRMAVVCEYIHLASLLHDDVVDGADRRRGMPSANALWGDRESVLVGDLVYARASELMAECGRPALVAAFAQATREMSEGELLQLECAYDSDLDLPTYETIIARKTASLMRACCRAAAILCDGSSLEVAALTQYGYLLGLVFQVIDDWLDYFGELSLTGKAPGIDLVEGRMTLPLILARDKMSPAQREQLSALWQRAASGQPPAEVEFCWLRETMKQLGVDTMVQELVRQRFAAAEQALSAGFPATPAREQLLGLARILLDRSA